MRPLPRRAGLQKMMRQRQDVLVPVAKRRQADVQHGQAIIKVLAETPLRDFLREVAIGGGKDSHVQTDRARRAQRLDAPRVQHAQQFDLCPLGQVADFVQEQRSAIGQGEAALTVSVGAGECASHVAEARSR